MLKNNPKFFYVFQKSRTVKKLGWTKSKLHIIKHKIEITYKGLK